MNCRICNCGWHHLCYNHLAGWLYSARLYCRICSWMAILQSHCWFRSKIADVMLPQLCIYWETDFCLCESVHETCQAAVRTRFTFIRKFVHCIISIIWLKMSLSLLCPEYYHFRSHPQRSEGVLPREICCVSTRVSAADHVTCQMIT